MRRSHYVAKFAGCLFFLLSLFSENLLAMERRKTKTSERHYWTAEEDEQLIKSMEKYQYKTNFWKNIAAHLNDKLKLDLVPKQCRERWINHLDPNIKKGKLTDQQMERILELRLSLGGNKWTEIAKILKISPNTVKNSMHALERKKAKEKEKKSRYDDLDFVPSDVRQDSQENIDKKEEPASILEEDSDDIYREAQNLFMLRWEKPYPVCGRKRTHSVRDNQRGYEVGGNLHVQSHAK